MGRSRDESHPAMPVVTLGGLRAKTEREGAAALERAAPRERADAARNRERILKAARKLARRKPLEAVCMDAIAEEAGVGKGTLYRRFADRTELARALLDEDARELQDRALGGFELPPTATSVEHVLALLGALFDFALDHAPILVTAQAKTGAARYEHPAYAWQRTMLVGHLRQAIRRGEVRQLDPLVVAELMLAGVAPELLSWLTGARDEAALRTTLLDTWRRTLLAG